eukprot:TRINITY_DN7332_c0_g2_i1.p1 TRINITY_DN7332_c0_g2~~TRINITY_DN7332_c0_g2_i1.p1  ORF type:complete len:187 (-),score=29.98 TRINITY_DN7332_c0_g2_i1:34-594(-)
MAKAMEQIERFEEMTEYVKRIIQLGSPLTGEERSLFTAAYKGTMKAKHKTYRQLLYLPEKECRYPYRKDEYLSKVEAEIEKYCLEILQLLGILLKEIVRPEARVLYLQMKGECYGFISEFNSKFGKEKALEASKEAFQTAHKFVDNHFRPLDPVRLEFALKYYEFLESVFEAVSYTHLTLPTIYSV